MLPPVCLVNKLGTVPYEEAWKLQETLATQIAAGEHPPALLLLEHPHTYTFGRRGQLSHLLWDQAELIRRGVSVHWVDRGGDVTYHGPGQLVGYPILPLPTEGLRLEPGSDPSHLPRADYVGYIRKLEEILIRALQCLGAPAQRVSGLTGVWVRSAGAALPLQAGLPGAGMAKIASIGVKVDVRGITRHGFALNVNPDMSYWQGIIGCGLPGCQMTSLAELLPNSPAMPLVTEAVIQAFQAVFSYHLVYHA